MGAELIADPDPKTASQTILVVEDEVLIRLEIADSLRDGGFHVLEAAGASEAVEILSTSVRVDLVFTDIQMPGGMDGLGLARWVRRHRPDARVLLTSGAARGMDLGEDLRDLAPIQEKPVPETLLLLRIRALLRGTAE
jgi:CheY-like chemotaxis protein